MGGIINHLQLIFMGNPLDFIDIAHIAIHMYRHDGTGSISNQGFYLFHVHRICDRIDIAEHWFQAVAHNGMCRGSERKGRSDYLSLQVHRLKSELQCHMAVCQELHVFNT